MSKADRSVTPLSGGVTLAGSGLTAVNEVRDDEAAAQGLWHDAHTYRRSSEGTPGIEADGIHREWR